MKSKIIIPSIVIVLLSLVITSAPKAQSNDLSETSESDTTLEIAIAYTTVYPGFEAWIRIMMKNPETPVTGFDFLIPIDPDVGRFCSDDTGGCMANGDGFPIGCECVSEGCTDIHVWAESIYISPETDYQTLVEICAKACCIPDSTTDRSAVFLMFPNLTSFIYDENGQAVPFRHNPGELLVWWSVPGDANGDSLVNSADVLFLINYLYRFWGTEPCVCEAADCNRDCMINSGDIVYLIGYLFRGGPAPVRGCAHCPHEDCRS